MKKIQSKPSECLNLPSREVSDPQQLKKSPNTKLLFPETETQEKPVFFIKVTTWQSLINQNSMKNFWSNRIWTNWPKRSFVRRCHKMMRISKMRKSAKGSRIFSQRKRCHKNLRKTNFLHKLRRKKIQRTYWEGYLQRRRNQVKKR